MQSLIPYSRQSIDIFDVMAVSESLRSDWLTCGPKITEYEQAFNNYTGSGNAIAVNSGTSALIIALKTVIKPGDEVITSPLTFIATSNAILANGGVPVFVDVDDSLLIDTELIEDKITSKTKAILCIDYAGHPCNYDRLKEIASKHNLFLIADAAHSIGATYKDSPVGSLAHITCTSTNAIKNMTTGEGGVIFTDYNYIANKARSFRDSGRKNGLMYELSFNYKITDFQCALGLSQLNKLDGFIKRKNQIAKKYDELDIAIPRAKDILHAFHLYVIRIKERDKLRKYLQDKGIGSQINYSPLVYLHPYYQNLGYKDGICPNAEKAANEILSIPMYASLTDEQVDYVIETIKEYRGDL